MGKKHFSFFQTAETGNRAPNSGVKGSGANHYPRAPARGRVKGYMFDIGFFLKACHPWIASNVYGRIYLSLIEKNVNEKMSNKFAKLVYVLIEIEYTQVDYTQCRVLR